MIRRGGNPKSQVPAAQINFSGLSDTWRVHPCRYTHIVVSFAPCLFFFLRGLTAPPASYMNGEEYEQGPIEWKPQSSEWFNLETFEQQTVRGKKTCVYMGLPDLRTLYARLPPPNFRSNARKQPCYDTQTPDDVGMQDARQDAAPDRMLNAKGKHTSHAILLRR